MPLTSTQLLPCTDWILDIEEILYQFLRDDSGIAKCKQKENLLPGHPGCGSAFTNRFGVAAKGIPLKMSTDENNPSLS